MLSAKKRVELRAIAALKMLTFLLFQFNRFLSICTIMGTSFDVHSFRHRISEFISYIGCSATALVVRRPLHTHHIAVIPSSSHYRFLWHVS